MCDWVLRRNALHLAARSCNVAMLRLLVEGEDAAAAAAYVNEPDKSGITALFLAMQKGARRRASWRTSTCSFALWSVMSRLYKVVRRTRAMHPD